MKGTEGTDTWELAPPNNAIAVYDGRIIHQASLILSQNDCAILIKSWACLMLCLQMTVSQKSTIWIRSAMQLTDVQVWPVRKREFDLVGRSCSYQYVSGTPRLLHHHETLSRIGFFVGPMSISHRTLICGVSNFLGHVIIHWSFHFFRRYILQNTMSVTCTNRT